MSVLLGVLGYEYRMAIRRWAVWLASALAGLPFTIQFLLVDPRALNEPNWSLAGAAAMMLNAFMPVVAGIAAADRLPRDRRLGVDECLMATPLSRGTYVLGKWAAAVLAALTPALGVLLLQVDIVLSRGVPVAYLLQALVAFLAVSVPAYLFVCALSLACPAVLPVRVYQVLFPGYWLWINYVNPRYIPGLQLTLPTPSCEAVASAFFGVSVAGTSPTVQPYTPQQAVLNLLALLASVAAVLVALRLYLARRDRRA